MSERMIRNQRLAAPALGNIYRWDAASLIGCLFILEEAVRPESAKDALRYPLSAAFTRAL
jgi:hypothetical protein